MSTRHPNAIVSTTTDDLPVVRTIGTADLKDALVAGFADFRAVPTHLFFLLVIYPVIGLIAGRVMAGYDMLPLVWPLLAGFTLIGPVVATGMYELSRRRERGEAVARGDMFKVFGSPAIKAVGVLGAVLMVFYLIWMGVAQAIYNGYFGGTAPDSMGGFIEQIFATSAGWMTIIVGTVVGFFFAGLALAISVVSFPLLLDRDVDVVTAVRTSVTAVLANPVTMATWGFIVAMALLLGSLPLFVGLAVVLPVLGHATWHLYRKLVER